MESVHDIVERSELLPCKVLFEMFVDYLYGDEYWHFLGLYVSAAIHQRRIATNHPLQRDRKVYARERRKPEDAGGTFATEINIGPRGGPFTNGENWFIMSAASEKLAMAT